MTRVINLFIEPEPESDYVYCGRGSKYGNAWSHKNGTLAKYVVRTRADAIWHYEKDLLAKPEFVASMIAECKGKTLGCYCRPKNGFRRKLHCHCQILAGLCDGISPESVE